MATRDSLIQVKNLKKHYNHGVIKALDDVSVDINKGDVMVVIGPSGSGKSTFLRSLNLLEEPTGGEIIFDGIDGRRALHHHRLRQRRARHCRSRCRTPSSRVAAGMISCMHAENHKRPRPRASREEPRRLYLRCAYRRGAGCLAQ